MIALWEERIGKEAEKAQPDVGLMERMRQEQTQFAQERDALTEENEDAHQRIFDAYSPILRDDELSEEKITAAGRAYLWDAVAHYCNDMFDVLWDQAREEEQKAQPDPEKLAGFEAAMQKCLQERDTVLRHTVAEQKAIIATYLPLIRAFNEAQNQQEAQAQAGRGMEEAPEPVEA